jgi:hypothetical protein
LLVFGQFSENVRHFVANAQSSATFANRSNSPLPGRGRRAVPPAATPWRREARLAGIAVPPIGSRFVRVCSVAGRFAASIPSCCPILSGCASLKPGHGGS